MYEFCSAALPWLSMAVTLAVFAAFSGGRLPARPVWASMGFFGGIVLASLLNISLTTGMLVGLTAGLLLSRNKAGEQPRNEEQ